jgi:hypothetical protein
MRIVAGLASVWLLGGFAWAQETPPRWTVEVAFTAPAKLGGCVIAEVDPARDGREVVTVSSSGQIFAIGRARGRWTAEVMAEAGGEMIQCAAGELDAAAPGDEVVAVGMVTGGEKDGGAGAAHVVRRKGDAWVAEQAFRDSALIHGVCVGDLDPGRPGNEILVVGFSGKATMVYRDGERWASEEAADLGSPGKNAVAFDGGALVACVSGRLVHVSRTSEGWKQAVLDRAPAGLARLGTDGARVVVARDDGALGLLVDGKRTDIYKEEAKLRGAVLADLDPLAPGIEAATGGYKGRLVVLHAQGDAWRPEIVFEDTGAFHHLAAGELVRGEGVRLVACGYSRRVVVVGRAR